MLRIHTRALAVVWSLTGLAGLNYGATITFTAVLSGANEKPATPSPRTGFTTVRFVTLKQLLHGDRPFFLLSTPPPRAHTHFCLPPPPHAGGQTPPPALPV